MRHEWCAVYEYVDDGAFVVPLMGVPDWASLGIWESGPQTVMGNQALRDEKNKGGGSCDTNLTLLRLELCAEGETISLHNDKLIRAQDFRSRPSFWAGYNAD